MECTNYAYLSFLVIAVTEPPTTPPPTILSQEVSLLKTVNRSSYPCLETESKCDKYPTPYYSDKWENSFRESVQCFMDVNASSIPFVPQKFSPLEEYE